MPDYEPILTAGVARTDIDVRTLEGYRAVGGWATFARAIRETQPGQIIQTVIDSGLRGRGGAGFPAGQKWKFLPADHPGPFYLVVNGDESEPGTFKDRLLMERNPHLVLEGIAIAAYATRARYAYVYLRGEFHRPYAVMAKAVAECYAAGLFGQHISGGDYSLDVQLHRGAGAYVCGEETGLLESLEGKRGWPRIKPPFPAVKGAFGKPTVINNIETLSCVRGIVERGAEWFKSIGPAHSTGPKLIGLSGHVNTPGVWEMPMGISLRELIEKYGGGMRGGKAFKSCIPGGASVGFLTPDQIDMTMDFEGPRKCGLLGLGTACAAVMDETVEIPRILYNIARFFSHESCGQCTHCREGTGWMEKTLLRLLAGGGDRGDLDLVRKLADSMGMMPGMSICGLADGAAWPIKTAIDKFRGEFEALCAPRRKAIPAPAGH
ncbi:MAG: NADH-quinone oxidoreductase chain 1 [Phycisphaerae bacterium]|nr:NADH-quinone oxidoreductase chain 1 [Phycisphaerae bacterium]